MRWLLVLMIAASAIPVTAENLLVNPEFDLDPTVPGNGWSTIGTGEFTWVQTNGDPAPPSARTDQDGNESMILYQCVAITGGTSVDFSARSYTHSSIGSANNGVALSVFASSDCSGEPIERILADEESYPDWALRRRIDYVIPANALSARIELYSEANGDNNYISWDNVKLGPQASPVVPRSWGGIKALFK